MAGSGRGSDSFKATVDAAVDDLAEHGFDSAERVAYWQRRLRQAAEREAGLGAASTMDDMIREVLRRTYERLIENGKLVAFHPGIERWTLERVKPELRRALDKRILASADLIRLRKKQRVEETLSRFSGWSTSIPVGGSADPEKAKAKASIKKPIASLPFEERRVLTDQGHKLVSSLNEITAAGGGAIAAIWRSNWRQPGYDYRPDHKDRDEHIYLLPKSWAVERGLIKAGADGTVDDVTRPAEEPFCRCRHVYIYSLRALEKAAPEMLTAKGKKVLADARAELAQ